MTVLHLHRPTVFPRKSMSAANMLCQTDYKNNELIHSLIWGIIAKSPRKEFEFNELKFAIDQLIKNNIGKLSW